MNQNRSNPEQAHTNTDSSSTKPTRRQFLQVLGMIGGTGMLMSGMSAFNLGIASAQERPPAMSGNGNGKRVVILGAGLAGMVAAYELLMRNFVSEHRSTQFPKDYLRI